MSSPSASSFHHLVASRHSLRTRSCFALVSLIALNRPSAFHADPALPSHTFRPGDPASIVPQEAVRKSTKASSKKTDDAGGSSGPVEGVVYKVRAALPSDER